MARARASEPTAEDMELADDIGRFALDPLGYVLYAFPWRQPGTQLAGMPGPRQWQCDVLDDIGRRLRAGYEPGAELRPVLQAIASGHGIGKSALVAMTVLWAMSTCPNARVRVTANTRKQLETTTWPEIAKWHAIAINRDWFTLAGQSLRSADPAKAMTWSADAVTWSKVNLAAFAGMHNAGSRILMVFDEASEIDSGVWEVAEGVLTDRDTEIVWLAPGNPTSTSKRFHRCFGAERDRWHPRHIDAREVEGTNPAVYEDWAKAYGEDSDFFRVRVRGQFPRSGSTQFISSDVADEACTREAIAHISDAVVIGVDVARFGDDESVIAVRKGRDARTIPWQSFRQLDTMQLASRVTELAQRLGADAVFIDEGGVGGGVVDRCRQLLGSTVYGIQFGGKADRATFGKQEATSYANKRAEMWGYMREWLAGGAIPDTQQIRDDMTGTQYGFDLNGAIQLERKADMKKRGLASPDFADALALTFAAPVAPRKNAGGPFGRMGGPQVRHEYDPYA